MLVKKCPSNFNGNNANVWNVNNDGNLNNNNVDNNNGIRPVINLKSSVEITGGYGTSTDPYVIKTN